VENLWLIVGLSVGLGLLLVVVVVVVSVVALCRTRGGKPSAVGNEFGRNDLELNPESGPPATIPEYRENAGLHRENERRTVDPDGRDNPTENYLSPSEEVIGPHYLTPSAPSAYSVSQNYLTPTDDKTDLTYTTPYADAGQLPDYLEIISDYQ